MDVATKPKVKTGTLLRIARIFPVFWVAAFGLASQVKAESPYSQLWGKKGELWDPAGRLPDFSFAGYHSGEDPLPHPEVTGNVKDFGAKGDGRTDDTEAFKKAILEAKEGALLIPAGRYLITDLIEIRRPNLVLRGEGPDKTILFFPKGMEQIKPSAAKTADGVATSAYSWSGGLIWVRGQQKGRNLGTVRSRSPRGSAVIELEKPPSIEPGDKIEIYQEDQGDSSLLQHLYAGQAGETADVLKTRCRFVSRVVALDGNKMTLERRLRTDVDPRWKPVVKVFQPSVTEVGLEDLSFEFPNVPYRGHFREDGYNPLAFSGVADCWARNIRIVNADSGPYLNGACFVTLENLLFEAARQGTKSGETGHHGVTLGDDNLLENFEFRCKFIHDISVEMSGGSVASKGKGPDLCFDHHRRFPHANLFTDMDLGAGTRLYKSGGGKNRGRHTGAWGTFWNLRSVQPQHWPDGDFGPDLLNLVGLSSKDPFVLEPKGKWFEPIPPAELRPQNLYEAQLALRLEKTLPQK